MPQGIVRLADLVTSLDRVAPKAAARVSSEREPPVLDAGSAAAPVERRPRVENARTREKRFSRIHLHDGDAPVAAAGVSPHATASGQASTRATPASPGQSPHDGQDGCDSVEGPAYESLFDRDPAAPARRKRERTPATALQRALGLLTRREHSRKELTRKLVSRGVDAAEVDAAVDRLTGAGWQDDRRFAEGLVRVRAANGYGPLHIRAELGTHDLPPGVREAALDEFDGDWAEIARDLVDRRFGRIEDARLRERKAADYLVRRGFPGELVRLATRFRTGD